MRHSSAFLFIATEGLVHYFAIATHSTQFLMLQIRKCLALHQSVLSLKLRAIDASSNISTTISVICSL